MTDLNYILFGASVIDDGWEFYPDWKAYLIREFDEVDESRLDDYYNAAKFVATQPRDQWRTSAETYLTSHSDIFPIQSIESKRPSEERIRSARKKPTGVLILSILSLISGPFIIILIISSRLENLPEPPESFGYSAALATVAIMLLGVVMFASGIGMLIGTRWGWWCATFFFMYSVATNANFLFMISEISDELAGSERGPEYYYFKHSGRVIINVLLTMYFFRENVLEYFGLTKLRKKKAFGLLCTAIITVFVLFDIFSSFS